MSHMRSHAWKTNAISFYAINHLLEKYNGTRYQLMSTWMSFMNSKYNNSDVTMTEFLRARTFENVNTYQAFQLAGCFGLCISIDALFAIIP